MKGGNGEAGRDGTWHELDGLGIGGSVKSAAGCSRRRTWRGTGRVVALSGTPEGDIGPDGAEGQKKYTSLIKSMNFILQNPNFLTREDYVSIYLSNK